VKELAIILGILSGATGSIEGSSLHYKSSTWNVVSQTKSELGMRDEDSMYRFLYILVDAYACRLTQPDVEWVRLSRAWKAAVWAGWPAWDEDKIADTVTLRVAVRLHTPPEDCQSLAEEWNGGPER
jgi:hypothetical protein